MRIQSKENTPDWELRCFFDWHPKYKSVPCSNCNGTGSVNGLSRDIDGSRQCPTCHGSRYQVQAPVSKRPEINPDLVEHMRRAWYDFNKETKP